MKTDKNSKEKVKRKKSQTESPKFRHQDFFIFTIVYIAEILTIVLNCFLHLAPDGGGGGGGYNLKRNKPKTMKSPTEKSQKVNTLIGGGGCGGVGCDIGGGGVMVVLVFMAVAVLRIVIVVVVIVLVC